MSALTADEQALYDIARSSLPKELFDGEDDAREFFYACAKILGQAKSRVDELVVATRIREASAPWLDQHAKDQGTRRAASESEEALRARLKFPVDTVNKQSLVGNTTLRVLVKGTAGAATYSYTVLFSTPAGMKLVGSVTVTTGNATLSGVNYLALSGIGYGAGTYSLYRTAGGATQGLVATATSCSFSDTGLVGDGASVPAYLPAAAEGVATQALRNGGVSLPNGYPALVELRHDKAYLKAASGNALAFFDRGYRVGSAPRVNEMVIILPYGTPANVAAAVAEAVRQRKGGGVVVYIERRLNP